MLPAGPLSKTVCGEILSSRQSFSASPSASTRDLLPGTAKMAMRKSGPMTMPVSLTSRNCESASLPEALVSGRRCVGLNSESANFRISGAAGSISVADKRVPGVGGWLLREPNSVRVSPALTTHPTRIKTGKRTIDLNTIRVCQSKDFIDAADGGEVPEASKMLVRLGASVNLTLATEGEHHGHFRSGAKVRAPIQSGGPLPHLGR